MDIETVKAAMEKAGSSEWYFYRSYVGTALWSTNDESDDCGGEPLENNYDESDLSEALRAAMKADCARFYAANSEHIHCDGAPLANDMDGPIGAREAAMAGHDFWLTRVGHGAGFWDGDWPDDIGDILTEASKAFGDVYLYVSDNGEISA